MKKLGKILSFVLAICLLMGLVAPVGALAHTVDTRDYENFVANLKVLERYASNYAGIQSANKDEGELIVNFIRTGVERYNESLWPQLAGQEITGFVNYVKEQDEANNTNAMALRDIELFRLPNGNLVDFGHMFGTMNIAYVAVQASADLGGWAGDICDLLNYSYYYGKVPEGTVEEMAAYVLAKCFGVDADDAFGMDDFYGDMDAFYLVKQMKAGETLSAVMETYFTTELDDGDRSAYFLNNRFKGLETKEDVRNAVYEAYTQNVGLSVLEADRGLSDQEDLRKACCYAFADYVYAQGGDRLEGDTGEGDDEDPDDGEDPVDPVLPTNPYYKVFSSTASNLAPGITQTINYATTTDGKQIVYYTAKVDVNRSDVTIMAGYKDANPGAGWGMQRVLDQAEALGALHSNPNDPANYIENFQPIVAINADGYNMSTGEPGGLLVMGSVEWHPVDGDGFFAILSDGSAMIGTKDDYAVYKDQIVDAIGGFGCTLILDGKIAVSATSNYYTTRASRTAIGITADGEVVMMVLDGRQEPFSAGGSMEEIAQIMLEAGCVHAINLDGGGSSTFVAKQEGKDGLEVVNSPSDGYARSVSTTLVAISTAVISNEFDYAAITSDYDYLTIGTELKLNAIGVSSSGHAAEIPANAVWRLSDDTIGVVSNGVFTATENGVVEVQLVVDDVVVGSKTLYVVIPDKLTFEYESISAIYGIPVDLPLLCTYEGNPVAINPDDIWVYPEDDFAAMIDGTTLIGNEEYGKRIVKVWAELNADWENVYDTMIVNLFKADEAMFDFDNATGGNKTLAWDRVVSNSTSVDGLTFQVVDVTQGMDVSYVFALDMRAISVPEKLQGLIYMLPGGDNVDATAWDFLMQLAERVSVLTEVRVTAQFDMDLDVDISGLKVVNDYFYMKSVELDEATNTVTLICGWVDQTQALDPSAANPLCILSGITAKPKADANWDSEDQLDIVVSGKVSYDIYLRANALYNFAMQKENQQKYGLIPFENPDVIINGSTEKGAHFADTYVNFNDHFILDSTNRQGWVRSENYLYYFVDNVALTGLQKLPGYDDPSNIYLYRFGDDGACIGTVTGLIKMNGGLYYYVGGLMKTGWQVVMENGAKNYYFFNTWSGRALNGTHTIGGYTYIFTDYVLTRGDLVTNEKGSHYMWAGSWVTQEWVELDGKLYYATSSSYFATGLQHRYSPEGDWLYYAFDETGAWMQDFYGIYDWKGGNYLIKNGLVIEYPGLFELDGNLYYISGTNVLIKNRQYWVSKTNGLVPEGSYYFDENGVMQYTPTTPEEPGNPGTPEVERKNGIYAEDGGLYYYVDGVRTYAGLFELDGNYYYARTGGKLAQNEWYWPTKTNGMMKTDRQYFFDENGVMQNHPFGEEAPEEPEEPEKPEVPDEPVNPDVKNGIVEEEDGLFYYENGVRTYAGLIKIDEYYYYVRTGGRVTVNCKYWVSKTNGLLEEGIYTFDEKGRIVFENVAVKHGIVAENDSLWYYVNGKLTYAGLIEIDGNYYYVRTNGELVHDQWYWPTKTNGYMETNKRYYFDANGVMQDHSIGQPQEPEKPETPETPAIKKHGIVEENGSLYYYVDGKLTYAGLIEIDGNYYYVRTNGELVHDQWYWPTKTNGLMKTTKQYYFNSNGVMQDPPVMNEVVL